MHLLLNLISKFERLLSCGSHLHSWSIPDVRKQQLELDMEQQAGSK